MTKLFNWCCPNDKHPAVRAPSRPRKDDVRRYCLPCSEKSGRLVERSAPRIEAKREARRKRFKCKAPRRQLTQADVPTKFACMLLVTNALLYTHNASTAPVWEVRKSDAPRAARVGEKHVVLYDHPGADKYDVRAMTVLAELRWLHLRRGEDYPISHANEGNLPERKFIRMRLNKTIGLHADIKGPIGQTWIEIAELLRAKDVCDQMGDSPFKPMGRSAA